MSFPNNFLWGAATASYQIEGAYNSDGKGLSVWDTFCRKENAVWDNNSGNTACDHYNRYNEDVSIMKELGLMSYRFSISWPRVIPEGTGSVNSSGLDFYDRLINELLENNIEPFVTLFHWDYPDELYKKGGWLNSLSPDWFSEYTGVIVDKFSDRVKNWIPMNEPYCFVYLGHKLGYHAPGDKLSRKDISTIAHNVLLAHGKSVKTIRSRTKQGCSIGTAFCTSPSVPAADSEEDIEAARKYYLESPENNFCTNTWWMDPMFKGKYPQNVIEYLKGDGPDIKDGDMDIIYQPLDFFGVNIYFGDFIKAGKNGKPLKLNFKEGHEVTLMDWFVIPETMYWGPRFFYERYKKPVIITENGMSNMDWITEDGKVHDAQRISFLKRYLKQLKLACRDNIDIRGYFHWSLMDNFEWAEGYKQRFGLTYIDYSTKKRILKDSAYWYKEIIKTNGSGI
jgi:beta-glucosidase